MNFKSPSSILVEFANEFVAAAESGSIEEGAQVLDSKNQRLEEDKGIVVSNAEWTFSPSSENIEKFFDALLIVGFYYRIPSDDGTEWAIPRDKCFELAQAFSQALFDDQTLGERVCDFNMLRLVDGQDNANSNDYAIINLPIILNPTGARDFNLGEAK